MSTLCIPTRLVVLALVLLSAACAPDLTVSTSSSGGGMGGSGGMSEASSSSSSASSGSGGSTGNLGDSCNAANECTSGFCADGVCCNESCDSTCKQCNQTGSFGSCVPALMGTDDCSVDGALCDSTATCACGVTAVPTSGSCPAPWVDGAAGSCVMNCDQVGECETGVLICPVGFDCVVNCSGKDSCRSGTLICPDKQLCYVNCSGEHACTDSKVQCSKDGPCNITCGIAMGSCNYADLVCGNNACTATCTGSSKPDILSANGSCAATGC